jgi:hypothetical protein
LNTEQTILDDLSTSNFAKKSLSPVIWCGQRKDTANSGAVSTNLTFCVEFLELQITYKNGFVTAEGGIYKLYLPIILIAKNCINQF